MQNPQKFRLTPTLSPSGLTLTLSIPSIPPIPLIAPFPKTYQTSIPNLQQAPTLSQHFDSLQQIAQHLSNQEHVEFDEQKLMVYLLMGVNSKKSKFVKLVGMKVEEVQGGDDGWEQLRDRERQIQIQREELRRIGEKSLGIGNSEQDLGRMLFNLTQIMMRRTYKQPKTNAIISQLNKKQQQIQQLATQFQTYKQQTSQALSTLTKKLSQLQQTLLPILPILSLNPPATNFITEVQHEQQITKLKQLGEHVQQLEHQLKKYTSKNIKTWYKVDPQYWVDTEAADFGKLDIDVAERRIRAKERDVMVFGRKGFGGRIVFGVAVVKMTDIIGVGFCQMKCRSGHQILDNCFRYFNDGICWIGTGTEQLPSSTQFKQCQTVEAHLNRTEGTVQWRIGSKILQKIKNKIISDREVEWVPYIQFAAQGDQVEVYGCDVDWDYDCL